ncbi:MAG: EAL domain-containing protein [Alphaproteobacteria bacterium]|nr:EAL domain-containing protein [Alphaproteobacteria bacterium]MBU6471440.1 EAL domain-containing protein [Alphaproteobacteria bacterium]MDE2014228.1 EAL domain-containing protein [Alphaproteobacteria bacterium]MDE2074494.1 EAL domain-containing protein [Alphaproteobacteria bacterium]MDE2350800.1 EAL domain-containing protein [Alphaproteobacteria bacterium]
MTNALIVATYGMASAAVAVMLTAFGAVPLPSAVLVAAVAFLLAAQTHASFLRRREKKAVARELHGLKKAGKETQAALDETRAKMEEMNAAIEERTSAQSRKIVSELKMLESLMREFAGRISQKAKAKAEAEEPVEQEFIERRARDTARSYLDSLGQSDLLETIRASLEENRVDLYLQPIVSLPQRKLRFYEALSRLRAEDGTVIMPAQYIKVAEPAGLMSVVDNLLLFRCVQIVRRLIQKSRDIGVFCNISGDTLTDTEFFPQFLEYMHHNRDLAGQIVFEFAQGAVMAAGARGEENLSYLSSLGFALSMDHVEALDLNFARLKKLGFRHFKVRAEILNGGMQGAQAAVAAEDFKKLLERHGLNLIAERVEDEKTVVQLLDYSVDFAQGYLFGEPRAVRDDSLKNMGQPEPLTGVIPFRRAG